MRKREHKSHEKPWHLVTFIVIPLRGVITGVVTIYRLLMPHQRNLRVAFVKRNTTLRLVKVRSRPPTTNNRITSEKVSYFMDRSSAWSSH